jgi:aconitase A
VHRLCELALPIATPITNVAPEYGATFGIFTSRNQAPPSAPTPA